MSDLFHGLQFIREHINEILVLTKEDWRSHAHKLLLALKN